MDSTFSALIALQRVEVADESPGPEDRGLDLGEPWGDRVAAGRACDAERDCVLLGEPERVGAPPGDLLERKPQRLRIGKLAIEQLERSVKRSQLGVGELDRWQVEVLRGERVVLLLDLTVDR